MKIGEETRGDSQSKPRQNLCHFNGISKLFKQQNCFIIINVVL